MTTNLDGHIMNLVENNEYILMQIVLFEYANTRLDKQIAKPLQSEQIKQWHKKY